MFYPKSLLAVSGKSIFVKSGLVTQFYATIKVLPAQTLIIALIAAVFTILRKIGDKSVKQEQGL